MRITVRELADRVRGKVLGLASQTVDGVSSLENPKSGTVVWVDSEKNLGRALGGTAGAVILAESLTDRIPSSSKSDGMPKALILVRNPRLAFAQAVALFHPRPAICKGINPTAQIAPTVRLGANVAVGAHVVIDDGAFIGRRCEIGAGTFVGAGVTLGEECRIFPGVMLYHDVTLGARCVVHAGAVIGSDGFGFVPHEGRYEKFPQVGTVVIGDDVEIGANTTIDRGALDATRIGRGTKIDNLVQIAHNVEIGEDVVIAAQTGISGGTVIEDHCVIGGQVGMGDHARVKRGAVVGSKGGILPGKIIREGQVVWGIPAIPLDEYKVINALWRGLPKLKADVDALKAAKAPTSEPKKVRKPSSRHGSRPSGSRKR
ncbi:MAG: UDP-3-O-(3-hydroxymyristoyl)glucosamine N-acyltransferase [Acidobacteriia bacterium]|nr:UDP-3-O-(3-hydroxymyristoyl)glucosamine N-acyltransferase [Terriglobia bacterium]